ncbi:lipid droplet-associated protein [Gordonia sp. ABSL11-1]|uniref:lipid droplet-associated protein n=1 Tax=Gordonia sp. ABSL11-1 TaxID=3053924 RepID=UPI0025733022|nr:lipid droplet-associated protein [Gordonia sp. ABSL11-1]MDL9948208.1 lipid droplet-associated protein [Gordonia sp. ABSL11-1]
MVRAPYPARIAAGLVVTAIEETKKLPALVITLPMTAVSQTLQAGMRMQQNIAELAIKGDLTLESLFEKPADQPEWARFDEDDDAIDAEADRTPIESAGTAPSVTDNTSDNPASPPARKTPPPKAATPKAGAQKGGTQKAGAQKARAQKASTQKASTQKPAKKTAPRSAASTSKGSDTPSSPDPSAGRFALYSAPPETVVNGSDGDSSGAVKSSTAGGDVPDIVEYIEYDNLTLAQLRAKLRSVGLEELEQLVAYEKATKGRAPFVTMIDNRIASQNSKRQQPT